MTVSPRPSLPVRPVTPAAVAERYFTALNARDDETLAVLYAPDARFDDNVFHHKDSTEIRGMWSKLPKDARVQHEIVSVDGNTVTAKLAWDYTLLGRPVHNAEVSRLTVVDGKIMSQQEHFDFGAWAHQLVPLLPASVLNAAEPVLARVLFWVT